MQKTYSKLTFIWVYKPYYHGTRLEKKFLCGRLTWAFCKNREIKFRENMTSCLLSLCLQGKRAEEKFMSRVSLIYAQCCSVVHKNCLSKKVHLIFSVTSISFSLYHFYKLNDFHPCYGIFGRTSIFNHNIGLESVFHLW